MLGLLDYRREKYLEQAHRTSEEDANDETVAVQENPESSSILHMFKFIPADPKFYMVCLICVTFYCAVFPFISLGQDYFIKKFGFSMSEANAINGNAECNNLLLVQQTYCILQASPTCSPWFCPPCSAS